MFFFGGGKHALAKMYPLSNTVNKLNFAAVKLRCLPIHALFRAIKFRVFWPTLLHKCGLNSLNDGPIFKIQSVSETRDRAPQYFACYLICEFGKNAKLNRTRNFADLQYDMRLQRFFHCPNRYLLFCTTLKFSMLRNYK